MAAAITESNLMVDDSDELSSKIFTTFPSFQESHSLLTPSQLKEDLGRVVTLVVTRKQILKNLRGHENRSHLVLWSWQSLWRIHAQVQAFQCAYVCVCTDPNLGGPHWNEISPVFLRDFIVFMVCIMSTHPLPPPSEQLDKIHLMVCQEVCFFSSSVRLSCRLLSFSINQTCPCTMISRSLSRMQTQRGETGQQLPMSENRRAATSALVSLTMIVCMLLTLHPPLLVTLQYSYINVYCFPPTTKDLCC